MARPKEIVDERLVEAAKQELLQIKDARLTIKLQAIVSVASYPLKTTAEVLGVNEISVVKWENDRYFPSPGYLRRIKEIL